MLWIIMSRFRGHPTRAVPGRSGLTIAFDVPVADRPIVMPTMAELSEQVHLSADDSSILRT
jgi:hypothetical protein